MILIKERRTPAPWLLVPLYLFLFGVLMLAASKRDMREDEMITFDGTRGTLSSTIQFQANDVEAPLYFVISFTWQKFVGDGEFSTRVLSALISMITLAVAYRIGRDWLGEISYGLAAMLGVGLSAYFFIFAVEIRPYALMMLASALSMYFYVLWLQRETWRTTLWYALTLVLMIYTHYLGVSLFIVQGLFYLLYKRLSLRRIVQGVTAYGLAFALLLPWLPTMLWQIHHVGQMATSQGTTQVAGLGMVSTTIPTNAKSLGDFLMLATNKLPALYILIAGVGLVFLWRKKLYWLILGWAIGVPMLIFVINLFIPIYDSRYSAHVAPGIGLLIGVSLVALPGRLKIVASGVFCVAALLTVQTGVGNPIPMRNYLRQAEAAYQPGDGVYLDQMPYQSMQHYQYVKYAPSLAAAINSSAYSDIATRLLSTSQTDQIAPRCLWFITNNWFAPGVLADFQTIAARRPLQLVIGNVNDHDHQFVMQRLCAPPTTEPHLFGDTLRFRGLDIESSLDRQIALKLWWDVVKQPTLDYSISVHVLDNNRVLVAQSDGPINDFYGRGIFQTSSLAAGNYYIDHRLLDLPISLPKGTYQIALSVYQSWDMKHLPIEGISGDWLTIGNYVRN